MWSEAAREAAAKARGSGGGGSTPAAPDRSPSGLFNRLKQGAKKVAGHVALTAEKVSDAIPAKGDSRRSPEHIAARHERSAKRQEAIKKWMTANSSGVPTSLIANFNATYYDNQ